MYFTEGGTDLSRSNWIKEVDIWSFPRELCTSISKKQRAASDFQGEGVLRPCAHPLLDTPMKFGTYRLRQLGENHSLAGYFASCVQIIKKRKTDRP